MGIHIELGSGGNPQPGYIHCEKFVDSSNRHLVDVVCDARHTPFDNECADSVLMFGVFEHFGIYEIQEVLLEVSRILAPGGTFKFDVPDFDWFMERYIHPEKLEPGRTESWVLGAIFGGQDGEGQFHKWAWNERRLREFLQKPNWNFKEIKLVGRQWRDPEPNHLIWECVK